MVVSALPATSSAPGNSPEIASSSGSTSQHVSIYSTFSGKNEELYVPVNSSGILVYPDWHIWLYGSGSFTFSSNGTTIETGVSLGTFDFSYTFPGAAGSTANASLIFQGVTYSFSDTIIGPLSHHVIESVSVSSSYPGQDQFLTVASGISGGLMYPHWVATLQSSENESYSILVNGQQIASGTVVGTKTVDFNVTGNVTSVSIGLGTHVYKYPDEITWCDNGPMIVSLNEYVTPWNIRDAFAVLPAAPGNVYEKSKVPIDTPVSIVVPLDENVKLPLP